MFVDVIKLCPPPTRRFPCLFFALSFVPLVSFVVKSFSFIGYNSPSNGIFIAKDFHYMALISVQEVSIGFGGPRLLEEINLPIEGGEWNFRRWASMVTSGN